jgi:hypothetical protein
LELSLKSRNSTAASRALILEHDVELRVSKVLPAVPASSLQHGDHVGTWRVLLAAKPIKKKISQLPYLIDA